MPLLWATTLSRTVAWAMVPLKGAATNTPSWLLVDAKKRASATLALPPLTGWTRAPLPPLSANSVFEERSRLVALGKNSSPLPVWLRMTQPSVVKTKPVLNASRSPRRTRCLGW